MFGYPNRTLIQTQTSKTTQQMGHWAQNQAAMVISVLWPEPYTKWARWTEEKHRQHVAVNIKGLEWFWMKEVCLWSLVRCSLTSSGIIGEHLQLLNWQMEVSKII